MAFFGGWGALSWLGRGVWLREGHGVAAAVVLPLFTLTLKHHREYNTSQHRSQGLKWTPRVNHIPGAGVAGYCLELPGSGVECGLKGFHCDEHTNPDCDAVSWPVGWYFFPG